MFTIISEPNDNSIALRINAEVTKEEYELALPRIEDKIKTHGKINLYCEIDDVASVTPGAVWEDFKFDLKHFNDLNKVALVGRNDFQEWMTKFGSLFTTGEVKYYNDDQKAEAMKWIVAE